MRAWLAWISLQGGDLVGIYGFDARSALSQPHPRHLRLRSHPPLDRRADLSASGDQLYARLAELNARLKRRALVILFTDFVDTITAELLIESMQRVANRHVVVFVTQRGSVLQGRWRRRPLSSPMWRNQSLRMTSCASAALFRTTGAPRRPLPRCPSRGLPVALINRYLLIKQRGLI